MDSNMHPLVVAILGETPLVWGRQPAPVAWSMDPFRSLPHDGCCWSRCDYTWQWSQVGDREPASLWRAQCGAIAGLLPDGTRRCRVHAMYWWLDHDTEPGRP
jgi:hypothetical protein